MFIRYFIVLILVISVSCGNSISNLIKGDPNRPQLQNIKEWPDSLVLETFYYGGMSPESDKLTIRKDSCIVESRWGQILNRYAFVPKQSDLNNLIKQLNAYSVDALYVERVETVTYDAPTSGFSIRLGSKFISISNGADESIVEKNKSDFINCYNLLNAYSDKSLLLYKRKVCFNIDASVKMGKGNYLSIIPERGADSYHDSLSKLKNQACFDFLEGKYSFQIHITSTNKNYGTKYNASIYPELDIKTDKTLNLVLKNDSTLVLE